MKTIFVIYTNEKIEDPRRLRVIKKYAFNTSSEVKVGDVIHSPDYDTNMQVVDVLDKSFKYYNKSNGEIHNTLKSTAQYEIAVLKIRDNNKNVVYGSFVK